MTYRRTATSFHMLSMDDSFNFVEDNASVLTELLISSFIQIGNIVSFYPREGSKNGVEGNQFSVGHLSLDSPVFIKILQPYSWVCQMFLSPEHFGFIEDCGLWERSGFPHHSGCSGKGWRGSTV